MGSSSWKRLSNRITMAMILLSLMIMLALVEGQPFTAFNASQASPSIQAFINNPQAVLSLIQSLKSESLFQSLFQQTSSFNQFPFSSSGNIVEQTRAQAESAKTILKSLKNNQKAATYIEKALETSVCLKSLEDAIESIEGAT